MLIGGRIVRFGFVRSGDRMDGPYYFYIEVNEEDILQIHWNHIWWKGKKER